MDANEVAGRVRREVEGVRDLRLAAAIKTLLVEPYCVEREWDYGTPGQRYPCWTVLEHRDSNTGIACCEQGFGLTSPWGLVALSGERMSIGMDCGWYRTLEAAFRESHACEISPPPGYEVP